MDEMFIKDINERLDLLDAVVKLLDERNHRWSVKDAVIRSNVLEHLKDILRGYDESLKTVERVTRELDEVASSIKGLSSEVKYLEGQIGWIDYNRITKPK